MSKSSKKISNEKMLFAISCVTIKQGGNGIDISQTVGYDYAMSKDEAFGRAYQEFVKDFPSQDGWRKHNVMVMEIKDNTDEPNLS